MLQLDRSRKLFVLIAALAMITACAGSESQTDRSALSEQTEAFDTLVTTEWLSQHLDDANTHTVVPSQGTAQADD